jgi:CheY-like chemotaxis protein
MGSPEFARFMWETRVKQESVKQRLHLPNTPGDSNWGRTNKASLHVSSAKVHKHRILCVDDDILGTTIRAEILREQGYSVVVYHSPLAVTQCDLSIFNLAILDFEMPGLNGLQLLLRMRALGARFPIVLLTGCLATVSHEDLALFAQCIDKGMPVDYLLDTIANFLDPNQVPDPSF